MYYCPSCDDTDEVQAQMPAGSMMPSLAFCDRHKPQRATPERLTAIQRRRLRLLGAPTYGA